MAFKLEDLVIRRGTTEPVMRVTKVETLVSGRTRVTVQYPDPDPRNDYLFVQRYLSHRIEHAPPGATDFPESQWFVDWVADMRTGKAPISEHITGYERALIQRDRDRLARSKFKVVH